MMPVISCDFCTRRCVSQSWVTPALLQARGSRPVNWANCKLHRIDFVQFLRIPSVQLGPELHQLIDGELAQLLQESKANGADATKKLADETINIDFL